MKQSEWTVGCCLALSAWVINGCRGFPVRDAGQTVDIAPQNGPLMLGSYDFDLLDEVEAKGCSNSRDRTIYTAELTGFEVAEGDVVSKSKAAAVFEAMAKVKGADLILISRTKTEGETRVEVCTTIWGRAVHLKKGPTLLPHEREGRTPVSTTPTPEPGAAEPKATTK